MVPSSFVFCVFLISIRVHHASISNVLRTIAKSGRFRDTDIIVTTETMIYVGDSNPCTRNYMTV